MEIKKLQHIERINTTHKSGFEKGGGGYYDANNNSFYPGVVLPNVTVLYNFSTNHYGGSFVGQIQLHVYNNSSYCNHLSVGGGTGSKFFNGFLNADL